MPKIATTRVAGRITAIDIVFSDKELKLAAEAAAELGLEADEVDPDDFWACPGCGRINSYRLLSHDQVMPICYGSCFDTTCGACRNTFAPLMLSEDVRNPILSECFTHVDHYEEDS